MSGIYLPGMEMPKPGQIVLVEIDENGDVFAAYDGGRTKLSQYKVVPVPPHGRLGDLDKLERMFADIDNAPYSCFDGSEPFYSADDAARIIRLAPTIIPADKGGDAE